MAHSSSSPESSSSPSSSSPSPAIFKKEDGDQHQKGLEIDDSFFLNDTQVLHDHLIQLELAKHGESELDDQILLLSNHLVDNSGSKRSLPDAPTQRDIVTPPSFNEPKNESEKKDDDRINRVLVDTAAPFESVRAAVTKFRGIVDCKAEETLSVEKQKQAQLELKKVQEEILKYQQRFQDEETATGQILEELDYFKGHAEELNLRLERAETLKEQAKQDSALADLRLREVALGIANGASLASRAQLDVANERHASAVAELKSVKEELELRRLAYVSLLQERDDIAVQKAADSFAATKEIEMTVQDLTLKLISTKELLESAHAAHLHAADQTSIAALTLDIEKLMWQNLLKHAEEELQQVHEQMRLTDDVKSELCRASTLLLNLKAELVSLDYATMEIEELRSHIEKSTESVNSLKIQLSSLQCDLEREKAALRAMRQREDSQSASISSLEAQLYRMNLELELVQKREGARKKKLTGEKQAKLQEASEEAEKKAKETLEGKKKELRDAMERLQKVEEEKLVMEQELDKPNDEQEHESFDARERPGKCLSEVDGESSTESPRGAMERAISTSPEPKRRKRMFFARIVTFLARKKVQSLK
ncbi:protein WEAK CHLOROPLAST MOVEMENT UNDER BLUE LIGHT 1-like [Curcuma longa]|uniref:protein WEAK CHLOROPLAST MOVEMENT UNDER BLUE LIGHT 1-like n=1 Tax=Curcuma longa TaxID=136217 RepID=UPI003D9F110B